MAEGPREPGYYASVTGRRPPGERPGYPRPGEPLRGPVALYGQVHRYGPRQARKTYMLRLLLGMGLPDIERVWKGPEIPVPSLEGTGGVDDHMRVTRICMAAAQAEAKRLNAADPRARGRRGL